MHQDPCCGKNTKRKLQLQPVTVVLYKREDMLWNGCYEAIPLELGEMEVKRCTTMKLASFFLEREGDLKEEGDQICLKLMEEEMQQISPVKDTTLENPHLSEPVCGRYMPVQKMESQEWHMR